MRWVAGLSRFSRGCPAGWKLTRAVSEGIDPRVEWHVSRCARCSAQYQRLRELAAKVETAFPTPPKMTRESREAIGARLRASGLAPSRGRGRRALPWVAALTIAVGAVLTVWGGKQAALSRSGHRLAKTATTTMATAAATAAATAPESRASIRAIGPARFERAHLLPDEIVRVDEGDVEFEIATLHAGERFRVQTADAEVEVRGTSFKVSVADHNLAAVHVWRGRVEVRSRGGAFAVLEAGDDWVRAPAPPAPAAPAVVAPEARRPRRAKTATASSAAAAAAAAATSISTTLPSRPDPTGAGGASFDHAWALLRQGDPKKAAAEFEEVERSARGRDIEEDALYWRAVAVARSGDAARARALFGEFLARFGGSPRAGEAAAALGWLLLDAGDPRAARRAFERAALDPSPRVRDDVQEGLRRTQEEDQ